MAKSDAPKPDSILEEATEAFALAAETEHENRQASLEDIRFARLNDHWPEKVRKMRELEGRPCLTIPMLPPVIRQVVNDARQNKPSIVVHPVDSASDPETAEIMNGLIRNIEQSSDAEVAYDTALDFAVTGGFGYFRINTRYATDSSFEQDLVIERVANPFSIYGDPHSTAADSSDWNTSFVVDTMPRDDFKRRWKGADAVDWNASDYDGLQSPWRDGEQVMVAEYWKREEVKRQIVALSNGDVVDLKRFEANLAQYQAMEVSVIGRPRDVPSHKVTQYIMTGAEVLETVDWAGKYIPIIPVYGEELFVDGKRHISGIVRSSKDVQRMFNYWRSTSTELVALAPKAPYIGRKGIFDYDAAKWATANTETHAFIEYDGAEAPQRQPFAGIPAGVLQEAMNASDDIKRITGIYDASLGAKSNETSGKAIMARQREGDVSTFHYIDNLSRAIRHAGRILIDLIPKVYSTERIVRVLGPNGEQERVPLKKPVTVTKKGDNGEMESIERVFDLSVGQYDLTVKVGPSFTSQREEAATQMIELIRAYPAAAPLIGDLLARNLDWPGADEIADRLKAMLPPQARGDGETNPEVEQAKAMMGQLGEALKKVQAELDAAKNDNISALKDAETKADQARNEYTIALENLKIDAFNAETNRIKALNTKDTPLNPAALAALVAQMVRDTLASPDVLAGEAPEVDQEAAEELLATFGGGAAEPTEEPLLADEFEEPEPEPEDPEGL